MTLAQHAALNRALEETASRLKALDAPAPDPAGDAVDRQIARDAHEGQVLGRAALLEQQRLILAALGKIARGEHGVCETCGRPIEPQRLDAMPWAQRCVIDQERAERAARRMGPRVDRWAGGAADEEPA